MLPASSPGPQVASYPLLFALSLIFPVASSMVHAQKMKPCFVPSLKALPVVGGPIDGDISPVAIKELQ